MTRKLPSFSSRQVISILGRVLVPLREGEYGRVVYFLQNASVLPVDRETADRQKQRSAPAGGLGQ